MTAEPNVVTCPRCGRRNRVTPAAQGKPRCGNCKQPLPWVVDAGDDDFAEIGPAPASLLRPWLDEALAKQEAS